MKDGTVDERGLRYDAETHQWVEVAPATPEPAQAPARTRTPADQITPAPAPAED